MRGGGRYLRYLEWGREGKHWSYVSRIRRARAVGGGGEGGDAVRNVRLGAKHGKQRAAWAGLPCDAAAVSRLQRSTLRIL